MLSGARSATSLLLLLAAGPTFVDGHGHHGIVHIVTLHFLPWISDRPWLVVLVAVLYGALCVWAYRRLVRRESEEEELLAAQRAALKRD